MIQALVRLVMPANKRQEAIDLIRCLCGPTMVIRGCQTCRIFQDVDYPEVITDLVQWETEQQLEEHLRSERFRRLLPYIELSIEPPEITFSTIDQVRGVEFLVATLDPIVQQKGKR